MFVVVLDEPCPIPARPFHCTIIIILQVMRSTFHLYVEVVKNVSTGFTPGQTFRITILKQDTPSLPFLCYSRTPLCKKSLIHTHTTYHECNRTSRPFPVRLQSSYTTNDESLFTCRLFGEKTRPASKHTAGLSGGCSGSAQRSKGAVFRR